jgi:hypothetical protein
MHNTPIGPTGAAMEKPIISPLRKKLISMSYDFGFWLIVCYYDRESFLDIE